MRRAHLLLVLSVALAACGDESGGDLPPADGGSTAAADAALAAGRDASSGGLDAAGPADASAPQPDAGAAGLDAGAADAGAAPDGGACAPGMPGCTCKIDPVDPAGACWHRFGGLYVNHGCTGGYQCCEGRWLAGQNLCAPCACIETTGTQGCVPAAESVEHCFPQFEGVAGPVPADVEQSMTGVSWRPDCPIGIEMLSLLEMTHWGVDGRIHRGRMVVFGNAASVILDAFHKIYDARFPIERMELVDAYGADDDASMAANNTSAFNCRMLSSGTDWSQHSYGSAIDVNPVQNPHVRGTTVLPPAGSAYLDRTDVRPGMIVDPGPVTGAFRSIGWYWGGAWTSLKDYQHFSINDR